MDTKPDWLERFVGLNTEAEVIAVLMETHGDIIDQMRAMLETMASRGLPMGFAVNMLMGAVVGGLLEAGSTPDEIRRLVTETADDVIRNLQNRPRA